MCVNGLILSVALSVVPSVPLAHYNSIRGIEVNPIVCSMEQSTAKFILYHEEAHAKLQHISRVNLGEGLKGLEYEADEYAIARMKSEGINTCEAVKPVLQFRGLFSFTHPNKFTLNELACKE